MSQYHYFDQLLTVLEEHVEFTSSAFGIPKQLFTAAATTVVGGMIGGPLGAMVGGGCGAYRNAPVVTGENSHY